MANNSWQQREAKLEAQNDARVKSYMTYQAKEYNKLTGYPFPPGNDHPVWQKMDYVCDTPNVPRGSNTSKPSVAYQQQSHNTDTFKMKVGYDNPNAASSSNAVATSFGARNPAMAGKQVTMERKQTITDRVTMNYHDDHVAVAGRRDEHVSERVVTGGPAKRSYTPRASGEQKATAKRYY